MSSTAMTMISDGVGRGSQTMRAAAAVPAAAQRRAPFQDLQIAGPRRA